MAKIAIDLVPWKVPMIIELKNDNKTVNATVTLTLDQVEPSTLADMCVEFRANVFKTAGKSDPFVTGHR